MKSFFVYEDEQRTAAKKASPEFTCEDVFVFEDPQPTGAAPQRKGAKQFPNRKVRSRPEKEAPTGATLEDFFVFE